MHHIFDWVHNTVSKGCIAGQHQQHQLLSSTAIAAVTASAVCCQHQQGLDQLHVTMVAPGSI
jgi:hypothetical protein